MTSVPSDTAKSVAVVGAGLAGLSAAYRLQEAGWRVRVFESDSRVGGRVKTVRHDGYLIDTGATALGAYSPDYYGLAEAVGAEIVRSSPYIGIFRDGRIHLLCADRLVRSGLTTKVISTRSKLKAARIGVDVVLAKLRGHLDLSDPRKVAPIDNENARDYALRVLNNELDQYLCEPVVRTMLIADTDKVSKVELFAGFANIMSATMSALAGGQGRLPELVADTLDDVQLNTEVQQVADRGDHIEVRYQSAGGATTQDRFDAAVIATPLPIAARICPDRGSLLNPLNESLRYTQAITVAVGTSLVPDCPAMLLQFPSRESPDIALFMLDHNKAADRVPPGHGLFGADWEMDAAAKWMDESDEDIAEHTLASVFRVFPELRGHITFTRVNRWPRALPLTEAGMYRKIGEFTAALDPRDLIQFASDHMSCAGQNTAVEYGTKAARNIVALSP
jgi:oxygen-dependent protoporphyrinogen oxidase